MLDRGLSQRGSNPPRGAWSATCTRSREYLDLTMQSTVVHLLGNMIERADRLPPEHVDTVHRVKRLVMLGCLLLAACGAPGPRALTGAEAERLAQVRFNNY